MPVTVKLDFDGPLPTDLLGRVRFVGRYVAGRELVEVRATLRGYHVEVRYDRYLEPLAVVAVQAILGSDFARETYNLTRVLGLDNAPAFWHDRWNVLYRAKVKEAGMTVRQDDYGRGKRPAWKWEDLKNATHAVLTVATVDPAAQIPDDDVEGGTRTVLTLTFEEDSEEKTLYTNYRQVGYLIERLGTNEKKWIGAQVVVKKLRQPFGKQEYKKVAVAPPEEWDEALAKSRGRSRGKARRK